MKKLILLLTLTSIVLIMGKNRRNKSKVPKLSQQVQPKGTKLERLYERLENGLIKVGNKWVPMNNSDINKIKTEIAELEDKQGIKR